MNRLSSQSKILVIGSDATLLYLFNRFVEQSGAQMIQRSFAPWIGEIRELKPSAIIFSSMELLLVSQTLVDDLSSRETLVLVCASVSDEARAREAGADACLFHPLTYENFMTALASIYPAGSN
jgi:hypothetical protein